jgi:hypothetical protein
MSMGESFAQSGFAKFMAGPVGRSVRVVAGLALIWWGYGQRDTTMGLIVMLIGLVPLLAGVLNLCLISALLGGPLKAGRDS